MGEDEEEVEEDDDDDDNDGDDDEKEEEVEDVWEVYLSMKWIYYYFASTTRSCYHM